MPCYCVASFVTKKIAQSAAERQSRLFGAKINIYCIFGDAYVYTSVEIRTITKKET